MAPASKAAMSTVSAADLVRNFPQCRDTARHEPVAISNHGRQTHVLVGLELWEDLHARLSSAGPSPLHNDTEINTLVDWIDDAVIVCDSTLNVLFANRVSHAMCRRPPSSLAGRKLLDALPETFGTLFDVHTRRTALSSEPSTADIPSPFANGAWLHLHVFPFGQRNIIVFRDISEDVGRHRMADVKAAVVATMKLHGAVGYVRLSVRGTVDRIDGSLGSLLGLPEERLQGINLADIADIASRPRLREALDAVFREGLAQRLTIDFIGNDGGAKPMLMAITPLKGAYGGEGAVCILTPA